MALDESASAIDAERYASEIANFIAAAMSDLSRVGVLVPTSGGLDSSVVASLAVRAVGKEKGTSPRTWSVCSSSSALTTAPT
ncbi:MAG: hypothetical protein ACYDHO_01715 [Gaiellaceae bacterium]